MNLLPADSPQDVYGTVLDVVLQHLQDDAAIPENEPDPKKQANRKNAQLLNGIVNRKVIKQTVMTSVYGVTVIGARAQVADSPFTTPLSPLTRILC